MRVPHVRLERAVRVSGFLFPGDDGVVGVPDESGAVAGRLQHGEQGLGVGEVAVRFDQHLDAAAFRVRRQLAQSAGHAVHRGCLRLVGQQLVAEHPNVRRLELCGEIDEPASLVEVLRPGRGIPVVQLRGGAEHRDAQVAAPEVGQRRRDRRRELGSLREIHLALEAADLERGVPFASRDIDNRLPRPLGATEGGEPDGQLRSRCLLRLQHGRRGGYPSESLHELPSGQSHKGILSIQAVVVIVNRQSSIVNRQFF